MSYHSDDEIKAAVRQLWAAWTRKPSDEEQAAWARALKPFWGRESLKEAMRQSQLKDDFVPSIQALTKRMHGIEATARGEMQQAKPLTESERRKAIRAAVLSMLWLHYDLGWDFERIGSHILATNFGGDPRKALEAAKEQYTPATVRRWMADQALRDPAPCDGVLGRYLAG